jgi:hypothetical protein
MRRVALLVIGTLTGALLGAPAAAAAGINSDGSLFTAIAPVRVLDTRADGPLPARGTTVVDLSARVPAGATAVVVNVTGVSPAAGTFVTVWSAEEERPPVSNVNLRAGETRANAATVAIGADRKLAVYNHAGSTNVLVDLSGYYARGTGTGFTASNPAPRVLDTRASGGALGAGATRVVDLSSHVPDNATAVTFNLTGASATANTFVAAWPNGTARPTASQLNLVPGQVTPNQVTVRLGADRKVALYNHAGSTHLVADLAGYYASGGMGFYQLNPVRAFDSRPGTFLGPDYTSHVDLSSWLPEEAAVGVFTLTGTDITQSTYLTAFPVNQPRPAGSHLNLVPGQTAANLVTARISPSLPDGHVGFDLYNLAGHGNVVVDLAGFFGWPPSYESFGPSLHTWGANQQGQLATGTTGGHSREPGRVEAPREFFQLAANEVNGFGLSSDSGLWVWGSNRYQGLGNGRADGMATFPVKPLYIGGSQLAVGARTAYVLQNDGVVRSWGYNGGGALGDGTTEVRSTAAFVALPVHDATDIAAGRETGYALRADGTVWTWGAGTLTPVQVPGLADVVDIAATWTATFAVKSDGSVWAWGANNAGQLGIGTSGPSVATPTAIPGLTGVAEIADGGTNTTYARKTDGTVLAWGDNTLGQLGNGHTGGGSVNPEPVPGLTDVTDLAPGSAHVLALRSDHTVWSWGDNSRGQLGLPEAGPVNTPAKVLVVLPNTYTEVIGAGGRTSMSVSAAS